MSEPKFTPGPWRVEDWAKNRLYIVQPDPADPGRAKNVVVYLDTEDMGPEFLARKRADAALIAAAPDLLAVLEAALPIVQYVSRGRRFVDVETYPDATARMVNAQIMDAIAKAKGEADAQA